MKLLKYSILFLTCTIMLLTGNVIAQQGYPIPPKTQKLLFYIQRNHNKNTIIYDANFDSQGNLNPDDPVDVYWIRYQEQGQRMELRFIEHRFAYGVTFNKIDANNKVFEVKIAAKTKKYFRLKQIAPFKAIMETKIDDKVVILNHIYVQSDNTSLWPRVKYYEQFGKQISTGENTYDKVLIN